MSLVRINLFVVVALLTFPAGQGSAAEAAFQAAGRWATISRPLDSADSLTNRREFLVETDGTNILIRLSRGSMDRGLEYWEFGTSDQVGYEFVRFADPPTGSGQNDATLCVRPATIPTEIKAWQLWLIFAGRQELQGRAEGLLRPLHQVWVREAPFDPDRFSRISAELVLRSRWSLHDVPLHFPRTFVNFRDGQLGDLRQSARLLPEEFRSGETNSRLDVLTWTNLGGMAIPTSGRLLGYIRDTNEVSRPLILHVLEQFEVTNVVAGTSRNAFVPEITRATRVLDFRGANDPRRPAEYRSTNALVIADPEEAFAEMERQNEKSRRRRAERKKAERALKLAE